MFDVINSRNKQFRAIMHLGALVLILSGCSKNSGGSSGFGSTSKNGGGTKNFKSKTGWSPNDQNGWFFTKERKNKDAWEGMVYVEGGAFVMGLVKDDVMHDWNNTPTRMQTSSFYIGETEITNYEYKEYISWLEYVFPSSEAGYRHIVQGAKPDSTIWDNKLSRNTLSRSYFEDPNYNYYPVVGVSWLQATRYCEWLTDRANEKVLMDKGILSSDLYVNPEFVKGNNRFSSETYINSPKKLFENSAGVIDSSAIHKDINIKNANPRINVKSFKQADMVSPFRLPTEVEWEYAALALPMNREYNSILGKPSVQSKLRTSDGRSLGDFVDNFKNGKGDYSGIGGFGNDGSAITSDVKEYPTNNFGIYGMFGNVAEWTADVYRPIIDEEANDFNYYRGNVTERLIQNEGEYKTIAGPADIIYDTLSNGRLLYKGLPGDLQKEVVEDNKNFSDGDYRSALSKKKGIKEGEDADAKMSDKERVYNSPVRSFVVDDKGRIILKKDVKERTSVVSDDMRVVKGGSWKDPVYFLDPAQRRFHNEASSSNWIGFRVAQDAVTMGRSTKSKIGLGK